MNKKELRDWHLARGNLTRAEADTEDIVKILVGGDSMASSSLVLKTILGLLILNGAALTVCAILSS